MHVSPATLALSLLFATASTRGQEARPGKERDGSRLVKVTLLADQSAVRAGETLHVGVQLKVRPGWHIYWENAGDAGVPTRVKLRGPEGFEIGAVRFPAPVRHEDEGEIVSYVHEGEILLVADVKAPATLVEGGQARFSVECDWLVCTDYCLSGSGKASLELPIAAATSAKASANEALFRDAQAKLPGVWKDVVGDAAKLTLTPGSNAESFKLTIVLPQAETAEFFPAAKAESKLVRRSVTKEGAGTRLELEFERVNGATSDDCRGVLWFKGPKGEASCFVEVPQSATR